MKKLSENILPSEVDLSGFNLQDKLNPQFWINNKLDSTVRKELLSISLEFIKEVKLPIINDIIFTGSLANYNWNSEFSDIDLHIVIDFSSICQDTAIAKAYCDEKKHNWNTAHTGLKILNYPVELYVQDLHEPHKSTGVYSILKDKWLTEPSLEKLPDTSDKNQVQHGVAAYCNIIDDLVDTLNLYRDDKVQVQKILAVANKIYDTIKDERKSSLQSAEYGELTTGNILFKTLRRNTYFNKLITLRKDCFDILHSI